MISREPLLPVSAPQDERDGTVPEVSANDWVSQGHITSRDLPATMRIPVVRLLGCKRIAMLLLLAWLASVGILFSKRYGYFVMFSCAICLMYLSFHFVPSSRRQNAKQLVRMFLCSQIGMLPYFSQHCRMNVAAMGGFVCISVMVCIHILSQLAISSRRERRAAVQDPLEWHGVAEILPTRELWSEVDTVYCKRCYNKIDGVICFSEGQPVHFGCSTVSEQDAAVLGATYEATQVLTQFFHDLNSKIHMYPFSLQVERMFTVTNPQQQTSFERLLLELSPEPHIHRLYHGTSCSNVMNILDHGFELPRFSSMFGKGIYFADVPQKSWQYSTQRYLLVCDVALGRRKLMAHAAPGFEPVDCDSVVGLTFEQGGSLRLSEYVVFSPAQVLPRYLLLLHEC